MLIADTASDAEAEALVTLDQLDLNQLRVPPSAYILKIDRTNMKLIERKLQRHIAISG